MLGVLNLAMPFFLLIFLGYASGRVTKISTEGLTWMNFFILYLALPALFFQLLSETPFEELAEFDFVFATTTATFIAFILAFGIGWLRNGGVIKVSTVQALVGSYSNVGYMGPGVTLAVLGQAAAVPTALILCFDTILLFILVPLLMQIGGREDQPISKTLWLILISIARHPFIIAVAAGILAAAVEFKPPVMIDTLLTFLRSAAAPCALFAMGVTIALQPARRFPEELPFLLIVKLILHPVLAYGLLTMIGGIDPLWVFAAVLMASLPPAANVYVLAQQYQVYIERASTAVLVGTIGSVFTVPIAIYLIKSGYLG
ncbi:AEC family transporter [Rhodobacteraceae bacterium RKSG542]|uniref:AEC family transporter n=1 Tax=Pseudovibrio flavus TaxID=2529854 RepID=UPI0012BC379E|nr:AEC family transporter [Pseudovibrio flavus]MTI17548.1 AEC family transporter [Pseudovibrio flavus]